MWWQLATKCATSIFQITDTKIQRTGLNSEFQLYRFGRKGNVACKIGSMEPRFSRGGLMTIYNLLRNTTITTTLAACDIISKRTQPTGETLRWINSNVTGQRE